MFLSELMAVGAASCIALSAMFISELNGRVGLFRLTRWQMSAAFLMNAAVATALGGWSSLGGTQLMQLAASGLFGIVIASTTYFAAIYTAGPRVTALLFALTSPFALALGYLVFGETITARQGLGVALVLAGVALAVGQPRGRGTKAESLVVPAPEGAPRPKARWGAGPGWAGIGLGVVTAMGQALGNLFARPAMAAGVEPFAAMAVRSGLAAAFFLALMAFPFARRDTAPATARNVATAVTSAFFGTVLGMALLMAALAGGDVGVVSTLSSMAPVAILPMVWLRTRVAPSPAAWIGAMVAILGTALISLR
ncbi:DMT family transporter [Ancylobacter sp. Lp-2]|uniref:DMT family transporter n=1 Tax=Ancylobacter sp. Lp-2 TaxID=2881339 RepID=UPI001E2ADB54|nr:DMT family transporter [Ancylobacter sp. Lp-2]